MKFHWDIITDNLSYLAAGYRTTIAMSAVVVLFALIIGIFLAAARMSGSRLLSIPSTIYIEVVRACPLLMLIFWVYFMLPLAFRYTPNPLAAAVIALTAYRAALMAEVVRSGILAIPPTQHEAAAALSFRPLQTLRFVILPQATVNMLPVFTSQVVATIKASSLAYIIGVVDLTTAAHIIASREFAAFEVLAFAAVAYLTTCIVVSWCGNALWRRFRHRSGTLMVA